MALLIAHRGDPLGHKENTIPGLVSAAQHGAGAIEVDIRCTAEGVPVLHHDATLRRVWGRPGRLGAMTVTTLRRHAPAVPTLRDALAVMRAHRAPLVLDIRSVTAAMACYAAAVDEGALPSNPRRGSSHLTAAHAARVEDRVWFCGNPLALLWLRRRDPGATLMLTWASPTPPATWLVRRIAPTYFNPWHHLVDASMVREWHAHGARVSTWTVDGDDRRARLTACGVDAIITNEVSHVGSGQEPSLTAIQP